MKKPSKIISGLDIQKEYMSVAQYSVIDNSVLLVAIQPLSLISGEDLGKQLLDELKELKSKFKFSSPDIVCSIPSEHAIVKHLYVDTNVPDHQETLEWELSQQIVDPLEEYVFDFQQTTSSTENTTDYLAVAYRKDTVHSVSSTIKSVKLNPLIIDLDIFALINVFEANYREILETPALIIHAENDKTKLIITHNGKFIDYECFEYQAGSLEPQSYAQKSKAEIDHLFSLNSNNLGNSSAAVFYTGALFSQAVYTDAILSVTGNAEILDPFRKIGCRIGLEAEQLKTYATQLAVAVGLAYRGND